MGVLRNLFRVASICFLPLGPKPPENQTTSGVRNTRVIRGSADGWDCLGPGTTPAILFK